jgi:hypothetical protein
MQNSRIVPLSYAIPDECIVADPPTKRQIWSDMIPGVGATYRFGPGQEAAYDAAYQASRFALTTRKGGWDCLRHYEILAAGTVPVFPQLELCPRSTMTTFPKELVAHAHRDLLPWADSDEQRAAYDTYVRQLLEHTRANCSTSALAQQFLSYFPDIVGPPRVLLLHTGMAVNYSREFLWIGLHRHLRSVGGTARLHPGNASEFLWSDFPTERCATIHGGGYKYSRRLPAEERPPAWSDAELERSIRDTAWDIIIYAPVGPDEGPYGTAPHLPFWSAVSAAYPPDRIAFLYGGDGYGQQDMHSDNRYSRHIRAHAALGRCFVRELNL